MENSVRWNIKVSKQTARAVRVFLRAQGKKRGGLSEFVEEAVRWRLFDQTVREVRERFPDVPPDEFQKMIGEAVADVRAVDRL